MKLIDEKWEKECPAILSGTIHEAFDKGWYSAIDVFTKHVCSIIRAFDEAFPDKPFPTKLCNAISLFTRKRFIGRE